MAEVKELLELHLNNVKTRIAEQMAAHNRNASGRSVASLNVVINGNIGILYGSKSFLTMEQGRKAGKVPYGFVDIIKQWIIDKGIAVTPIQAKTQRAKLTPAERGLNSFAGAVAYTIMKKGTKLYRDKGYNDIFTSAINEELKLLADELVIFQSESLAKINNESL